MYKIPVAELKEKIIKEKNLSADELESRIKTKINELSGLISEEGAAHIIANELGVEVVEEKRRLKVKEVYAGMRDLEIIGKIVSKSEIREFQKEDRKGKVANLVLGDDTGTLRVVCWGDQTDLVKKVSEGDVLLIKSGYAKENNFNQKEIHLNDRSEVEVNPEGEEVGEVRQGLSYQRKKISELNEGMNGVEVLGTIVQVFDLRFFNVCPQCAKKVTEQEEVFECAEHGKVTPDSSYVLNLVIDDGTGNMRSVFWKNQATNLLGKKEEEIVKYKEQPTLFGDEKSELLGEQFRLIGRVNRNDMFDRLEFSVQMVFKADAEEEIKRLGG
ncbi:MAG: OB-fold nucleic acid binding domain-containing protein [Candidatus Woesearchaeota archaeon]